MMVSRPAQGSAVIRDGPRYTNMYETRNPARTLVLATLVAPTDSAPVPRIPSIEQVQRKLATL